MSFGATLIEDPATPRQRLGELFAFASSAWRSHEVPLDRQILRCRVELRDLRDGAMRNLPVGFIQKISLKPKNGSDVTSSCRVEIHVQDGAHTWIAADVSDLSAQLRTQYPHDAFERTLRCERDVEAEERLEAAIEKLAEILARAAIDEHLGVRRPR